MIYESILLENPKLIYNFNVLRNIYNNTNENYLISQ